MEGFTTFRDQKGHYHRVEITEEQKKDYRKKFVEEYIEDYEYIFNQLKGINFDNRTDVAIAIFNKLCRHSHYKIKEEEKKKFIEK